MRIANAMFVAHKTFWTGVCSNAMTIDMGRGFRLRFGARGPIRAALWMAILPFAPAPALAGPPDVVLVPYQAMNKGVAPELLDQVAAILAEELKASGLTTEKLDALAPTRKSKAKSGGEDAKAATREPDRMAFEKAKTLVAQAKKNLEADEAQEAVRALSAARDLVTENVDAVLDLKILADIHFFLGIALFRDGSDDHAEDALSQSVHLLPTREVDERDYPPVFVRTFQRVRFTVLARPRSTLRVVAPAGALVTLDGRTMGRGSIDLTDVLPGIHWIRAEKPGEPSTTEKRTVHAKTTQDVDLSSGRTTAGDGASSSANEWNADFVSELRAVGKKQRANIVISGGIYRTETAYNIYTLLVSVGNSAVGRAVDVAFDIDMLSAQIEVFRLVRDIHQQVSTQKFANLVQGPPYVLSAKLAKPTAPTVSDRESKKGKIESVRAAPPPVEAPRERAFVAEAGDKKPIVAARVESEPPTNTPAPPVAIVPKDEATSASPKVGADNVATPPADLDDKDEASTNERRGGFPWWIWVAVGAAAAGGATAGVLALRGSTPSEATVNIAW